MALFVDTWLFYETWFKWGVEINSPLLASVSKTKEIKISFRASKAYIKENNVIDLTFVGSVVTFKWKRGFSSIPEKYLFIGNAAITTFWKQLYFCLIWRRLYYGFTDFIDMKDQTIETAKLANCNFRYIISHKLGNRVLSLHEHMILRFKFNSIPLTIRTSRSNSRQHPGLRPLKLLHTLYINKT